MPFINHLQQICCAIATVTLVTVNTPAVAVEPQPGQLYSGGTEISVASLGLKFTIPPGWNGALSPTGEAFLMEPPSATATMFAIADRMSAQQAHATMQGPVPLTDAVQLVLDGKVSKQGTMLSAKYTVSYNPNLVAEARAQTGANGTSVAFFLVSATDTMNTNRKQLDTAFSTVALSKVTASTSTAGNAGNSSEQQSWQDYLKGKHIVRFFTGSGYTEEQHIWLCSNGQYARRFDSGGFGGGASGAFQGNYDGSWTATGKGEHGQLILNSSSGQSVYDLRWDYGNSRLYVDDKRWLHSENKLCN